MRVLLTGGTGYIGKNILHELFGEGHNVHVVDNYSTSRAPAGPLFQRADLTRMDLTDLEALREVFARWDVQAVVHMAAKAQVKESVLDPLGYYRNNLLGMMNVLSCMVEYGVKHIVFSSSAAVYGMPDRSPVQESDALSPINPYGRTKRICEDMIRNVCAAYGIRAIALRYFNAAGANVAEGLGEDHDPETHLIPNVLRAIADGQPFPLFGTDYDTPDGTAIRDYVHVSDLARAHTAALAHLERRKDGHYAAYNAGYGKGLSNQEILNMAKAVTGGELNVIPSARREGDPPVLVASAERIQRELGWTPAYAHRPQDIIADAWAYMQSAEQPA